MAESILDVRACEPKTSPLLCAERQQDLLILKQTATTVTKKYTNQNTLPL